jgi:hypothetical protein
MSTYHNRLIEVKNSTTGKWELLEWYVPAGYCSWRNSGKRPDVEEPPLERIYEWYDNDHSYFDELEDYVHEGLPSDASNGLLALSEKYNKDDWWRPRFSYLTLAEMNAAFARLKEKIFSGIIEDERSQQFNTINRKLDALLRGENLDTISAGADEDPESWKEYYMEELFHDMMSFSNDIAFAYRIVDDAYGWKESCDIRLIFYNS